MSEETTATKGITGGLKRRSGIGQSKVRNYLLAIAINDYDHQKDLSNCVRDAEDLITLLTEDFEFEREHVRFICGGPLKPAFQDIVVRAPSEDETVLPARATRALIFREVLAMRDRINADKAAERQAQLDKGTEEDKVNELKANLVLFFSGHGWFDAALDMGYWITSEARSSDHANCISNGDIRIFLESIDTHHTVLLSDSCHSGSLFFMDDAATRGNDEVLKYLEEDPSRWGLSSGGYEELVSDGDVGTNSPFVEFLLRELKKSEDIPVSVLANSIKIGVRANTNQLPIGEPLNIRGHMNGEFVFHKKVNAERHFHSGRVLMELAEYQPEYERFRSAARQFEKARILSKKEELKAASVWWEARALNAAGMLEEAKLVLEETLETLGNTELARPVQELQAYTQLLLNPKNSAVAESLPPAAWLQHLIRLHRDRMPPEKDIYLLSIGIDEYPGIDKHLSGCVNDADLLTDLILERFGENRTEVVRLRNEQATHDNILHELKTLVDRTSRNYQYAIIQYSGIGMPNVETFKGVTPLFTTYDTSPGENVINQAIGAEQFHDLLQRISEARAVVILDKDGGPRFEELAENGDYTLLMGTSSRQHAKEKKLVDRFHGVFSYYLTQHLKQHKQQLSSNELIEAVMQETVGEQTPKIYRADSFFEDWQFMGADPHSLMQHLLQELYGPYHYRSTEELRTISRNIEWLQPPLSAVEWAALGRRFLLTGEYQLALKYYEKGLSAAGNDGDELQARGMPLARVHLDLAQAYISQGRLDDAQEQLDRAESEERKKELGSHSLNRCRSLQGRIRSKLKKEKRALLVGLDDYYTTERDPRPTAENLLGWERILQGLGFQNIKKLENEAATYDRLKSELEELAGHAESAPAFFYFLGYGTASANGSNKALLAYDSDLGKNTLSFDSLRHLSRSAKHLTTLIEAGFYNGSDRYKRNTLDTFTTPVPPDAADMDSSGDSGPLVFPFGNACFLSGLRDPEKGLIPAFREKDRTAGKSLSDRLQTLLRENGNRGVEELLRALLYPDAQKSIQTEEDEGSDSVPSR